MEDASISGLDCGTNSSKCIDVPCVKDVSTDEKKLTVLTVKARSGKNKCDERLWIT